METEKAYIKATQIIIYWSDGTEGEICMDDAPEGWDEWLSEIERKRNLAGAG